MVAALGTARAEYRRPGRTERASVASSGAQCCDKPGFTEGAQQPVISSNGRFVAFSSNSPDLIPMDHNLFHDVFVRDLKRRKTEVASISSTGQQALAVGGAGGHSISASGRYVAFGSDAPNLVPGDTNNAWDIFVRDRTKGATVRVSVASNGRQTASPALAHDSQMPFISDNGRYVVFESEASDLVVKDTNGTWDVFVHDRKTRRTQLISKRPTGAAGNGESRFGALSANGRHVVFSSRSSDLLAADTNTMYDTFVYDRRTHKMELISVASDGRQASGESLNRLLVLGRSISGNGRYVMFQSRGNNLVPVDTTPSWDVFVRDRQTKRTERMSVSSIGAEGDTQSALGGAISGNGRFVAFETSSSFVSDDPRQPQNPVTRTPIGPDVDSDVYVHDRVSGATVMVSRASNGTPTAPCRRDVSGGKAAAGDISGTGRFVVFTSCSPNLVARDTNETWDVFVRDSGSLVGSGSVGRAGSGTRMGMRGSSSFARSGVAFFEDATSDAHPAALGRGAELVFGTLAYRPRSRDLFVKIDVDVIPGPRGLGALFVGDPHVVYGLRLTAAGVNYEVRIAKHGDPSRPGVSAFGLFRCTPVCIEVADLQGSYGTVGESVTASVPIAELSELRDGGSLDGVVAFSAYGTYLEGPVTILDLASPI